MNLASIQMSSVAFSINQTIAFFHGPVPIISDFDPVIGMDTVIDLSARLLSDGMESRFPVADRFSTAAAVLARFNKAN